MAPDYTPNVATIRSRASWRGQTWACTIPQTVVVTGTVTVTPTFPVTTVAYTVNTGSAANVKADQRIVFYTSGGVRKGETRVRFKATVTSVAMPIAETSANTINIVSGDTFTVYEQWNIQDRLVSATSDFNKDTLIAVGTYGNDPPPVANAGGLRAAFFDAGQSYTTHQHDASTSYVVDSDSSTFTVLWDVGDGTITVGTTTTTAITVRYPAGFRHISLTITDSGNGKSTVKYVPVWSFDPAGTLPMRVTSLSLNSTTKDGWSGQVEIARESAHDLTTLPDGSLIVLFEKSYYGSTQVSYRSAMTGGSNILAALFLESETIDFQPGSGAVTFRAEGPLAVLKRTPALPQLMISGSGGTLWSHLKTLTVNRALWYLAFWHATVMDYFDFLWLPTGSLNFPRIAVENIDSIAGQLSDVSQSILADPTCDALGRILIIRNPNYLSTVDRAALVTTWAFTVADIVDGNMDRVHHGSVKHVRGEGITTGSVPVFSNAGNAPSPIGTGSETLARQIVGNQADINTRTGKHFALVNGLYNGVFVPQGVRLSVPDGYAIFDPAYREWVTVTLASSTNDRAVSFTAATRWTVDAISISYDSDTGGRDVEITVSHETDGPDGVTYVPPASSDNGIGPINLPGTDFPPIDYTPPGTLPASNLYKGTQRIAAICDNGLALTTNFGSGALTVWTYVAWSALATPVTGTMLLWVPDGFVPGYGWLVTSTKVWYGPLATMAFALKATFATATPYRSADASFGQQNHFCVVSYIDLTSTRSMYTTDNSSFTEATITTNHATGAGVTILPGCYYSPRTSNRVYTSAHTNTAAFASLTSEGKISSDGGATFATMSSPALQSSPGLNYCIHVPYNDNAAETIAYYGVVTDVIATSTTHKFYRSVGVTKTDISPAIGGTNYTARGRYSIQTSVSNRQRLLLVAQEPIGSTYAVFRSDNAGAIAPSYTVLDTSGSVYRGGAIAGDNPDVFYLFGASGNVALITDAVTIVSQTGNLASFTPGTVLALAGY